MLRLLNYRRNYNRLSTPSKDNILLGYKLKIIDSKLSIIRLKISCIKI